MFFTFFPSTTNWNWYISWSFHSKLDYRFLSIYNLSKYVVLTIKNYQFWWRLNYLAWHYFQFNYSYFPPINIFFLMLLLKSLKEDNQKNNMSRIGGKGLKYFRGKFDKTVLKVSKLFKWTFCLTRKCIKRKCYFKNKNDF